MKNIALIVMLLAICASARGQDTTAPVPKDTPSIHEQIKADRAKAKAADESGSKARFWDRDHNGKRPWEKDIPPMKE
jgi:hypothetical protein